MIRIANGLKYPWAKLSSKARDNLNCRIASQNCWLRIEIGVFLKTGYRHGPLTQDMLGNNPEKISVQSAVDSFQKNWDELYSKKAASGSEEEVGLLWPLLKSFGLRCLWSNSIAVLHYSIAFVSPQVLKTYICFKTL